MSFNSSSSTMDPLAEIQRWYHSQCNGKWEHSYGIKIQNVDNPGWLVEIDLSNTELENVTFSELLYGLEDENNDWLCCRRSDKEFIGSGGPHKLTTILETFLKWAHENQVGGKIGGHN